jgi:hypothetical protein
LRGHRGRGSQQVRTPEVKEEIRKRTVREVASFVSLFKRAGILVACLDGRRREIEYEPDGPEGGRRDAEVQRDGDHRCGGRDRQA